MLKLIITNHSTVSSKVHLVTVLSGFEQITLLNVLREIHPFAKENIPNTVLINVIELFIVSGFCCSIPNKTVKDVSGFIWLTCNSP